MALLVDVLGAGESAGDGFRNDLSLSGLGVGVGVAVAVAVVGGEAGVGRNALLLSLESGRLFPTKRAVVVNQNFLANGDRSGSTNHLLTLVDVAAFGNVRANGRLEGGSVGVNRPLNRAAFADSVSLSVPGAALALKKAVNLRGINRYLGLEAASVARNVSGRVECSVLLLELALPSLIAGLYLRLGHLSLLE